MNSVHDQTPTATLDDALEERRPIAAEANFLRLPLFALHTKGLKHLDGFECRGTTTRGEETWEFLFRTARSTATLYPGPLSRAVHLALLSLIAEQGRPLANPITWTWRNLCVRLGVQPSGRTLQHLKEAVEATAGLTIFSRDALYSKSAGKRISTRKAMHLYDTVVFVNESLPDGSTADANYLWLSGWYLDNLNSLFTAPLDHTLWRYLDKRSPIASRLYEFLLINFYSGVPQLRINYPRLAQFLPVRPERYLSDARKQLEPAFKLLTQTRVASGVQWQKRKHDVAQLRFERGERLLDRSQMHATLPKPATLEGEATITVKELRRTAEQELVSEFYQLWNGHPTRHTSADLVLAKRLIAQHGKSQVKKLLPLVVDELRKQWPGAKTFVAIERYIDDVAQEQERKQQLDNQRRIWRKQRSAELQGWEQQAVERQQFETEWLPKWEALSTGEQETIRQGLLVSHPYLRHAPHQLQFRCLQELARRLSQGGIAA